ncbi:Uncharacterised protein [Mycobacterium tuberculosis]|nr:Uncharacterised protein [Mycobacterium tuberculosis]
MGFGLQYADNSLNASHIAVIDDRDLLDALSAAKKIVIQY